MECGAPWVVVDVEKKQAARRELLDGGRLFDEYQDRILAGVDDGRVADWDVVATWPINSNIGLEDGLRWLRTTLCPTFPRGMGGLHPSFRDPRAELLELTEAERRQLAVHLDALRIRGFQLASVTKTLAARRPNAVPMLDSLVVWMLTGTKVLAKRTTTEQLIERFATAARALEAAHGAKLGSPTRHAEKLLWFDGVFPMAGDEAKATAKVLVKAGWRLVVWQVEGAAIGSAGKQGGRWVDGCVALLGDPPDATTATVPWADLGEADRGRIERELRAAEYPRERWPKPIA
jgi:hypothetical protein